MRGIECFLIFLSTNPLGQMACEEIMAFVMKKSQSQRNLVLRVSLLPVCFQNIEKGSPLKRTHFKVWRKEDNFVLFFALK